MSATDIFSSVSQLQEQPKPRLHIFNIFHTEAALNSHKLQLEQENSTYAPKFSLMVSRPYMLTCIFTDMSFFSQDGGLSGKRCGTKCICAEGQSQPQILKSSNNHLHWLMRERYLLFSPKVFSSAPLNYLDWRWESMLSLLS